MKYQAERQLQDDEPLEKRGKLENLYLSEIMTILVSSQKSHYLTFKDYYQYHICIYLRWPF